MDPASTSSVDEPCPELPRPSSSQWMPYYFVLADLKQENAERFKKAISLAAYGFYDDAEAAYSELHQLEPDNPFIAISQGIMYENNFLAGKKLEVVSACKRPEPLASENDSSATVWDLLHLYTYEADLVANGKIRPALKEALKVIQRLSRKGIEEYDRIEVSSIRILAQVERRSDHHSHATWGIKKIRGFTDLETTTHIAGMRSNVSATRILGYALE